MSDKVKETLGQRNQFLSHLREDLKRNKTISEEAKNLQQNLRSTIESIKILSEYPQQEALIPLGKNIYMNGRIIHTGEYYSKKPAFPDSYITLQTLNQTVQLLEHKIDNQNVILNKTEYANSQLEERISVLTGCINEITIDEDMPDEIKSDKGVAVKVGEFYEILEFED